MIQIVLLKNTMIEIKKKKKIKKFIFALIIASMMSECSIALIFCLIM